MKLLALILTLLAVPLGVFGWWGTSTAAGRAKYDEMDGLYPLRAGVLAIGLVVAAAVLFVVAGRHAKGRENGEAPAGFPVTQSSEKPSSAAGDG
ncbi:MAG TPA: hypothetical protein VK324_09685 [Tepidisphaeraceae bacterium]|nr:hypothetical protein [Tepidisphaeraceae bacterium]